jgi:hypothetical protein
MSSFTADDGELRQLIARLDTLDERLIDKGERIVGQGALNIKRSAQRRVDGLGTHLPHLARSFTYDRVTTRGTTISTEIGSESERLQGKLDVFIEYGTPTSAPHPHWGPAADEEEPKFARYVEDLGVEVLDEL